MQFIQDQVSWAKRENWCINATEVVFAALLGMHTVRLQCFQGSSLPMGWRSSVLLLWYCHIPPIGVKLTSLEWWSSCTTQISTRYGNLSSDDAVHHRQAYVEEALFIPISNKRNCKCRLLVNILPSVHVPVYTCMCMWQYLHIHIHVQMNKLNSNLPYSQPQTQTWCDRADYLWWHLGFPWPPLPHPTLVENTAARNCSSHNLLQHMCDFLQVWFVSIQYFMLHCVIVHTWGREHIRSKTRKRKHQKDIWGLGGKPRSISRQLYCHLIVVRPRCLLQLSILGKYNCFAVNTYSFG